MKGVVFTEFLELVEVRFSANMVDDIIDDAKLPHGGAYTSVGTYDHQEIVAMVVALSSRTGLPVPDLLKVFGQYLFARFVALYPQFFVGTDRAMDFLAGIEDIIHAEVRKLYPDAELPSFEVDQSVPGRLVLTYQSHRHMEDLAEGLIAGCFHHFGETMQLTRENIDTQRGSSVRFILTC